MTTYNVLCVWEQMCEFTVEVQYTCSSDWNGYRYLAFFEVILAACILLESTLCCLFSISLTVFFFVVCIFQSCGKDLSSHQLHYQCFPWGVHSHSVSTTTIWNVSICTWEMYSKYWEIVWVGCFHSGLITTQQMWWWIVNQSTWAFGIQLDRKTTTDCGHCPTLRRYNPP